jgi:hypothetical protein
VWSAMASAERLRRATSPIKGPAKAGHYRKHSIRTV